MLHQPRDLALVRRMQELVYALPPGDREHRRISHPAERPPDAIREKQGEIERRDHHHRGHQHRHRRKNPAHDDQTPPPTGEGLEFLQNEGIDVGIHG